MKGKLLLAFVALVFLTVSYGGTSFAEFGSVSGRVTDQATGDPIAGAAITLSGIYCAWLTDAEGYYVCDSVPAGAYIVNAYADGYFPQTFPDSVTVFEGQDTPNIDFALISTGQGTGSISGTVTDEVTGEPIAHAAIILSDLDCDCVWFTDSMGHYLCDHIPPGTYLVGAHKEGYHPETYPEPVMVIGGQNTPNIDFALTPIGGETGTISGRVTDANTGLAIIMARVVAVGLDNNCHGQTWSDTGGYYAITSLCPGTYQVVASKESYAPEIYPDSVIVLSGEVTPGIDFALAPIEEYGSISGLVTDEETGFPISMAHLVAVGLDNWCYAEVWSDTDGYYVFHHMCPGIYMVNANAQGYAPETYPDSVPVIAGENTSGIDFALAPEGGPEFGSISGRVTDERTGLPIIMAEVTLTGIYGVWYTDTAGYYMCHPLPPGSYQVNAWKHGYVPETYPQPVTVIGGQNTAGIDFALTPVAATGSISGRVTDEETGVGLPMAHVWAHDTSAQYAGDTWTDTAGYYLMQNLAAGQYVVGVHKDGYEDEIYPELVVVEEGQTTPDIDFALTPLGGPEFGSISGRVTDEQTGLPIVMAEITITGIYCIWHTDSAGYYLCDNLMPGSYEVNARKFGYVPETYPDSVFVVGGQNTPGIDFALTPIGDYGSISGRVTDEETGLPIVMARLLAWGLNNWCFGEAWSDSGGYYQIQNLCAGIYRVDAHKPGYVPEAYPDSVVVLAGEDTPNIDIALAPIGNPGSISGTVTDANTGEPICGAEVWAHGEYGHGWAHTDSSGAYTISGLYAGDYFVSAWAWGYHPQDYPTAVTVVGGQDTPGVDFALIPYGAPGDGVIEGVVLDDGTLAPIPFSIVFAVSWNRNWGFGLTDSAGTYMIQGLPADDYYVFAIAPEYIGEFYDGVYTWEEATAVTPDAYGIDFYLGTCGSAEGVISGTISSNGSQLEGALVYAELEGEVMGSAIS